jgi:G patch domain-containing protein 1
VNESIGAELLKQMGWKEGQGIGQRVRRRKFQEEEKEPKLLMQEIPAEKEEPHVEEEVYVPPRKVFDVEQSFPKPKVDRYGAGFDPYTDAPEFSAYKQQEQEKQRAKEGTHRQVVSFLDAFKTTSDSNRATAGYGLSALEENDDIDVYGTVSMQEFDKVIAPLGARANVKRLDSSAQESQRHEKARRNRVLCSDGRPVLTGYELASAKEKPPKVVNLRLFVPSGFKGNHRFADDEFTDDAVTALNRKFTCSANKGSNGKFVTAKQRGVLLRDDQQAVRDDADAVRAAADEAMSSTGSIFDMLGEEQRAKLFDAAALAKQRLSSPQVVRAAAPEKPAVQTVRQPLVRDSRGDQFRATSSASLAKKFVSSKSTAEEEASVKVPAEESQVKVSRRSQSLWIPKSLLCKRFHVKCAGPMG